MIVIEVGGSTAFQGGERRVMFSTINYDPGSPVPDYAVTPDDQHFIMMRPVASARRSDVTLVLNFFEDLKARAAN
jgi:hypothetical protein